MHQSILRYGSYRYGWWALVTLTLAITLYCSQGDFQPPNGGTWQGYVLGSAALALVLWLTALGVVKRRYGRANVQAWTSAHVYLGLVLWVVASLHCAMQFGFNVHTLAYVLMCVVIVSGIVGLSFYLRYPRLMVQSRDQRSREQLFDELSELNRQGQTLAGRCQVDARTASETAISRTGIGGGLLDQLFARDTSTVVIPSQDSGAARRALPNRDQQRVIDYVAECIPRARKQAEAESLQQLLEVLCRRQVVARQLRADIKYHARLKVWLWLHIPGTVATLAALLIHVFAVFFYW